MVRAFVHGAMGHRIDPSWGGPIDVSQEVIKTERKYEYTFTVYGTSRQDKYLILVIRPLLGR